MYPFAIRRRLTIAGTLLAVLLLAACQAPDPGPVVTPVQTASVTPTTPQQTEIPTADLTAIAEQGSAGLQAGLHYPDPAGDISVSFLDVVGFHVTVDEARETVEAVFEIRDIPETAEQGAVLNFVEYQWTVSVYLDPDADSQELSAADYLLNALTFTLDGSRDSTSGEPVPGSPVQVPIHRLISSSTVNNQAGESIASLAVAVNPEANTLTFQARVPGVTGAARFSFETSYIGDAEEDRPDLIAVAGVPFTPAPETDETPGATATVPDGPEASPSPLVESTTAPDLEPAGRVRAYPGPEHYAGDVLTLEIRLNDFVEDQEGPATLTLEGKAPFEVTGVWRFDRLILPKAVDTNGLTGERTLHITANQGPTQVSETYRLVVLPAEQRPPQEDSPAWQSREIACCTLHYLSGTAAARDIEQIAGRFQTGAEAFTELTGTAIDERLQVYLIDRMWGNGAFGGGGELVVSYTDRYYGPSLGLDGLDTLVRHEFTHATGVDQGEEGFFRYNEGLAVFLAGGHYKPEPLAQRGAAMYELGYYVPVGSSYPQHEIAYLYGAVLATYIQDTYGREGLWDFVAAASGDAAHTTEGLESAVRETFDQSLAAFEADYIGWLQSQGPGEQLEDLRLTVELQDLRRRYQETYAPPPLFIFGTAQETILQPESLPALIREPSAPVYSAVELMIANGNRAIWAGRYADAGMLVEALRQVLETGQFAHPLAAEYLSIVEALAGEGYETLSLELNDGQAEAQVTRAAPDLETVGLRKVGGVWQISGR